MKIIKQGIVMDAIRCPKCHEVASLQAEVEYMGDDMYSVVCQCGHLYNAEKQVVTKVSYLVASA